MSDILRVRALIEAAQAHLDEFGDTPVGIVVNAPSSKFQILHVEDAVRTGRDKYEPEDEAEWRFEIEVDTDDYEGCERVANYARAVLAKGATTEGEAPCTACGHLFATHLDLGRPTRCAACDCTGYMSVTTESEAP